ncbi:hypothetical protein CK203_057628 [Vitis vinifera]|uniref:Uncharacterized protein n=1 Tax=Vitis vinifera TaxID=29760 RepID=A0A438GNL1_VITVI|nr:hypothetical protein CK203_057628 [Vitis vinifera]
MEVGFAAQKKEMETEYQRQVDEMYFFGYRCYMKKNGIMHDIPSLPSNEEDAIPGAPPAETSSLYTFHGRSSEVSSSFCR